MATPNQITVDSDINDISIDVTDNLIEVVDENCPTEITVTQPVTKVIQVATVGPQGPVGPQGIDGTTTYLIATGSVSASVNPTGDIFTVTSASVDIFSINYQGVITLQERSLAPTVVRGGIFFSGSGDFFVGS